MNISIKNKFAVITIIMSILSLIFAYIISDEFISRNLDEKESLKQKEKVTHIEKEFNNRISTKSTAKREKYATFMLHNIIFLLNRLINDY